MKGIVRLFDIAKYQMKKNHSGVAYYSKYNGKWKGITNKDLWNSALNLAKGLLDLGIKPNDKIAIITDRNITEWHIIDLALLQIGVQSVPIYASTSDTEMNYIFNHAEISACFVANSLYSKIKHLEKEIATLKHLILFEQHNTLLSIYDFIKIGKKLNNEYQVDAIKNTISGDSIATIIYTSGTTAMPKGVIITHNNLVSGASNAINTIPREILLERTLSFLPVSHIFERLMLYMYHYRGTAIYFAENIKTLSADMAVVRPDIMAIVPRLLEKIHEKILEKRDTLTGIKKFVFNWALDLGYNYMPDRQNGAKYERKLKRARKLVFSKWLDIFGGNLKIIICGGSKLQPEISKVFNAAGIAILEGYGLTESSGVGTINSVLPGHNRIGTVGLSQKDLEIKIAKDGEILLKGPMIMKGYYKDSKKTEEVFENGFFKTGDLGTIDSEGFLTITGRKKELFKTSGGKYVVPSKIEGLLSNSKYIGQLIVVGENERFPAAIIQLNFELFEKKYPNLNKRQISKHLGVIRLIQKEIDTVNEHLGQWEKIKKFELTPDEWTTEDGHLTPTMKLKRDIIRSKYFTLYSRIYR